jgi:hypothetical protein
MFLSYTGATVAPIGTLRPVVGAAASGARNSLLLMPRHRTGTWGALGAPHCAHVESDIYGNPSESVSALSVRRRRTCRGCRN